MPCYPPSAVGLNYISYPVGPSAGGIQLTDPTVNNTKSAYTEIIASTPFECDSVIITAPFVCNEGRTVLLDIAIGGAGAESVVIPNILLDNSSAAGVTSWNTGSWQIPLNIPSGSRISARWQINNVSTGALVMEMSITLVKTSGMIGITSFVNIGADTSDSGGTQIDPGGVANTKGSYVQLVASTADVYQFLCLLVSLQGNAAPATTRWAIDIATGGAGAESVLIPDLRFVSSSTLFRLDRRSASMLTYIPAGTRIAVRASCEITDATDRLIDVALLVGTAPSEPSGGGEHSAVF